MIHVNVKFEFKGKKHNLKAIFKAPCELSSAKRNRYCDIDKREGDGWSIIFVFDEYEFEVEFEYDSKNYEFTFTPKKSLREKKPFVTILGCDGFLDGVTAEVEVIY